MTALLIIFAWILPVVFGGIIGYSRGRPVLGVVLPLLFSWLGVLVVVCLSAQPRSLVVSQHTTVSAPPVPTVGLGIMTTPPPVADQQPADIHDDTPCGDA